MEARLALFGHPVRAGCGLRRVALVADEAAASVTYARTEVGPVLLQLVAPYGHVVGRAFAPADVLPPDDQVGDKVEATVLVAARHRRTRTVHCVRRVVEPAQVGRHVVAAHPEPREDAPHHHRRVVVVLGDDLLQLLYAVLLELRRGEVGHVSQKRGAVQRRVYPDQQALLVAAVVEILRVGHDGRTQGVGSQIADLLQVGVVILRQNRAARNGVVVVERHAMNRNALAVDRKAARRGYLNVPEPRAYRHAVRYGLFADAGRYPVERRRGGAPQLRIGDREGDDDGSAVETGFLPFGEDFASVRGRDVERQHAGAFARRGEIYLRLAFDQRAGDRILAHEYALRTEVER